MKRILIIGISGTGKSYTARKIRDITGLPLTHLDSIFWKENWVEADEPQVQGLILNEINKDSWIIEGYIEPCSEQRLKRADKIIYLDYNGLSASIGVLKRFLKHRKSPRPEMPAGNTDKFSLSFLKMVFKRQERPEIESTIKGHEDKTLRLKNRSATKKYLKELQSQF